MSNTIIANDPMAWAVDYGTNGMLVGQARCSTTPGTVNWNGANSTFSTETNIADETGVYCYCNVTGYKDINGNLQSLSSSWVHISDRVGGGCAYRCAYFCSSGMRGTNSGYLAFRAAVLGSVTGGGSASCEANIININWTGADANDISANNAETTTYGSDVRTPVKAQTIKGKTFKGWRFSKPTQVQSCTSITDQSTCINNGNCTWSDKIGKCFELIVVEPEEPIDSGGSND